MKTKNQLPNFAIGLFLAFLLFAPFQIAQAANTCLGETGKAAELCTSYCEELDCDGDSLVSGGRCNLIQTRYTKLTGRSELSCQEKSLGCFEGNPRASPPAPFDVGNGNDYGACRLELSVPEQCYCVGEDCTPCPLVVGYHDLDTTTQAGIQHRHRDLYPLRE